MAQNRSEFGIADMHGNVWEWCEDVWYDSYNNIPSDGTARLTGGEQNRRALRGGSWNYNAINCRSACRGGDCADYSYLDFSFRVVFA